jgi:2-phosphoglycerate kinase
LTGDWTVLFIGGPGGVGKTSAAKRIATISGATLLQADDIWFALQSAIDPSVEPLLHAFSRDVWRRPATERVVLMRELSQRISSVLERVVGIHLWHDDRVVIEGVWITPELMSRTSYDRSAGGDRRRAVVVFEGDAARIREAFFARPGFEDWSDEERDAMAATQVGHARWLRTQALMRNVPIVDARPVGHLAERILAVL